MKRQVPYPIGLREQVWLSARVATVVGVDHSKGARGTGWGLRTGAGGKGVVRRWGDAYLRFSFQALYHLMNRLVLCSLGCRQCS